MPDAEIKAAFRSKNARFAFARKDKKAWFRIDLAGQALNESCVSLKKRPASHKTQTRVWQLPRSEDEICVQRKREIAFNRKDKKAWLIRFRIDLAGQTLNAVWIASLH